MDGVAARGYAEFAMEAGPLLAGPDRAAWIERIEAERDGVVGALEWLVANGDSETAVAAAGAIWRFWLAQDVAEGRRLLGLALAAEARPSSSRAHALYGAATLAFRQGDNDEAERLYAAARDTAVAVADTAAEATALGGLARISFRRLDAEETRERAAAALELARATGSRSTETVPLHMLAAAARMAGDWSRARELYSESIALNQELGNVTMVAGELHNLGYVELHSGDLPLARERFSEAFTRALDERDTALLPYCVLDAAVVAEADSDAEAAALLLGAADALLRAAGTVLDPDEALEHERLLASLRAALPEDSFDAQRGAGAALGRDAAFDLAGARFARA